MTIRQMSIICHRYLNRGGAYELDVYIGSVHHGLKLGVIILKPEAVHKATDDVGDSIVH